MSLATRWCAVKRRFRGANGEACEAAGTGVPVTMRAINRTLRAIEQRARLYRRLVIAVVAVVALSIVLAAAFWSWIPLLGPLSLVPLCGLYLVQDGRRVGQWREEVLAMWCSEGLQLAEYEQMIQRYPKVPPHTLAGMLGTLPRGGNTQRERDTDGVRGAVAAELRQAARRDQLRTAAGTAIATLLVAAGAAAAVFHFLPLLAAVGVLLFVWLVIVRTRSH